MTLVLPFFSMKPTFTDQRQPHPFFKRIGSWLPTMIILGLAVPLLVLLGNHAGDGVAHARVGRSRCDCLCHVR